LITPYLKNTVGVLWPPPNASGHTLHCCTLFQPEDGVRHLFSGSTFAFCFGFKDSRAVC